MVVCIVFIAAWRTGGKPERYVATIYFVMLLAGCLHALLVPPSEPDHVDDVHQFRAWLDTAALVAVVLVAIGYDRWWTLWVGSVQFIAVMAHVLQAFQMPVPLAAYAVMERWPVWAAVLFTGIGTILHHRRTKAQHIDT